jgi:hypothetical protein
MIDERWREFDAKYSALARKIVDEVGLPLAPGMDMIELEACAFWACDEAAAIKDARRRSTMKDRREKALAIEKTARELRRLFDDYEKDLGQARAARSQRAVLAIDIRSEPRHRQGFGRGGGRFSKGSRGNGGIAAKIRRICRNRARRVFREGVRS